MAECQKGPKPGGGVEDHEKSVDSRDADAEHVGAVLDQIEQLERKGMSPEGLYDGHQNWNLAASWINLGDAAFTTRPNNG